MVLVVKMIKVLETDKSKCGLDCPYLKDLSKSKYSFIPTCDKFGSLSQEQKEAIRHKDCLKSF